MTKIDFGSSTNKDFNDLADELITQVLRDNINVTTPEGVELTLDNFSVSRPDDTTYTERKLHNRNMRMQVRADLVDEKTRRVIHKKLFLGTIPYRTQLGTYLEGSDYNIISQPRNKPSVYTSVMGGDTAVSSFQVGTGRSFKLKLLPKSGKINMYVGSSSVPLTPLLDIFNVTDLDEVYGKYTQANSARNWGLFYKKINKLFFYNNEDFDLADNDTKNDIIKDYFTNEVSIDAPTTQRMLGVSSKNVNGDVLKAAVKKLIAVHEGNDDGDDRYDLRNNTILTPSHLFADRLDRQLPRMMQKKKYQIEQGGDPSVVLKDIITKPLVGTILGSDLARLDPQYNILGAVLGGKTITSVGEGAIGDMTLVEDKGRQFQMSQLGVFDATFTTQGTAVGLNLRAAPGLVIEADGNIKLKLKSISSGRVKAYDLEDIATKYILHPGEKRSGMVDVIHDYATETVDFSRVTHEFAESIFADSMQMVPFPNGFQGPRGIMAATQFPQAVALKNREAPRVVPKGMNGKGNDENLGKEYLDKLDLLAPLSGTIISITDKYVTMESDGGQQRKIKRQGLIPLQANTGIDIKLAPKIVVGAKVTKGQPLFLTNFHDETGRLALGTHLKVLYAADAEGYGVEDGIIISETAANTKLVSEHVYKVGTDIHPNDEVSLHKLKTFYGHKYKPEQLANIDVATGAIKEGVEVNYGDVLVCKLTKFIPKEADIILGRISKTMTQDFMDTSTIWDKFHHGTVTQVIVKDRQIVIVITTEEVAEKGSKLTGRFGNKGVVSLVLPDAEMPKGSDGKAMDIILSPTAVPSRVNPNQIQEAALGRTGKKYILDQFDNERDNQTFTESALKLHGMNPDGTDDVYDPRTGKTNKMGVGEEYFLKLFSPEKSISARGALGSYDTNLQPVKGGKTGSKALGLMEFWALKGHNAEALLKEFGTIKSEKNVNFWRQFELGLGNMPKNTPYTFDKFSAMMQAAGAKVQRSGENLKLVPITDADTAEAAGGRTISEPVTVKASSFKEIKDGLFDPNLTGGVEGTLWSEYQLADGVPHPLLEDILRSALDVSRKDWDDYITDRTGKELSKELNALDLKAVKKRMKANIKNKKDLSAATKTLRFLTNLEKQDKTKLGDFILNKMPIIPPKFRPLVKMQDGSQTISDLNYLYLDTMQSDKLVRESGDLPSTKKEARKGLIDSFRAFIGMQDTPSAALQKKGVKGVLTYVAGKTSPKEGYFLDKMMKRQAVMTGRARILPNPMGNMDEIGIPEHIAWNTYEPHIRKQLARQGFPPDQITAMIDDKTDVAKQAMLQVLKENYILVNRAPTLHKFSILAGRPKLVDGPFISIPNAYEGPLNADYDGDEITVHAPLTEAGKKDAHRMLLSQNPFSGYAPNRLTVEPDSEAVFGFHTKNEKDRKGLRKWVDENISDTIKLPEVFDKKGLRQFLTTVAKEHTKDFGELFPLINRTGIQWASEYGLTVSLKDIKTNPKTTKVLAEYIPKIEAAEGEEKLDLAQELQTKLQDVALGTDSMLARMVNSGSKANKAQLSAILSTVGVFQNPRTNKLEIMETNTSKGFSFKNFIAMNGRARKEMVMTKLNVAPPGDLYKQIAFNSKGEIITEIDCGTERFILAGRGENDLIGRLIGEDIKGFKKDTPITRDMLPALMELKEVPVRSPLTCEAKHGLCAMCYGIDDFGKLPKVGDHINIQAVNSFSEPLSQTALNAKHSGRSLKEELGKSTFEAAKDLFSGVERGDDAVLSTLNGVVTAVTEDSITIDSKEFLIPSKTDSIVSVGDEISIGMPITSGIVNTRNVANSIGHGYASTAFVEELQDKIFEPAGISSHRRNIEVVAKSLYRFVQVEEVYRDWLPGDTVNLTEIAPSIKKDSVSLPVSAIKDGSRLGDYYGSFKPLDIVTPSMRKRLKEKTVLIFPFTDKLKPLAKGVASLPMADSNNWLDNFAFRYIKRNIQQAIASGAEQSVNPIKSPVAAYVTNSE